MLYADERRHSIGDMPHARPLSFGYGIPAQTVSSGYMSPMIRVVDKQQAFVQSLQPRKNASEPVAQGYSNFSSQALISEAQTSNLHQLQGFIVPSPRQGSSEYPVHAAQAFIPAHEHDAKGSDPLPLPIHEQLNGICNTLREEADEWRRKWLASEVCRRPPDPPCHLCPHQSQPSD